MNEMAEIAYLPKSFCYPLPESPWRGIIFLKMRRKLIQAIQHLHGSLLPAAAPRFPAGSLVELLLLRFVRTRVLMSRLRLNNRATMEADILSFTAVLTPEAASFAPCFPFHIMISLSWFHLLCLHYTTLYHRGRGTSSWFRAVTLVTLKIQTYPDCYRICIVRDTIGGYRITAR